MWVSFLNVVHSTKVAQRLAITYAILKTRIIRMCLGDEKIGFILLINENSHLLHQRDEVRKRSKEYSCFTWQIPKKVCEHFSLACIFLEMLAKIYWQTGYNWLDSLFYEKSNCVYSRLYSYFSQNFEKRTQDREKCLKSFFPPNFSSAITSLFSLFSCLVIAKNANFHFWYK